MSAAEFAPALPPSPAGQEYALFGKPRRDDDRLDSYTDACLVQFYEGMVDMAVAAGVAEGAAPAPCARFDAAHIGGIQRSRDVPLFEGDMLIRPAVLGSLGVPALNRMAKVKERLRVLVDWEFEYAPHQRHPGGQARQHPMSCEPPGIGSPVLRLRANCAH